MDQSGNKNKALTGAEISVYYRNRAPKLAQTGSEWRGPCPVHEGRGDSFSVQPDTGVWFCHSKCGTGGSIFQLEEKLSGETGTAVARAVYEAAGRPAIAPKRNGHFAAAYGYTDESGQVLFECVRFAEPKGFAQRHSDVKGGYIWNLKGVRLVPYRLPKILAANSIFICEGEKDCHALEGFGLVASCNPMGAGCWRPEFNEYFRDKKIVVMPDADEVGQKHGNNVAQQLSSFASEVRVVNVPGCKDVTEWIESGGTAQELEALVVAAPVYVPLTETTKTAETALVSAQAAPVSVDFDRFRHTDAGNAELFVKQFGGNLRYVPAQSKWLLWTGHDGRWVYDELLVVNQFAIEFTKRMLLHAAQVSDPDERDRLFKHASNTQNAARLDAMLRVARSFVTISPKDLDAGKFLLNCLNGTIDLLTGNLQPHNQADLITKQVPVVFDPAARCEEWEQFLLTIMKGDEELVGFLRRAVGYTLCGDTREEVFFFLHGKGRNGKGTFRDAIKTILGDYSLGTDFATFQEASFAKGGSAASPDIARMAGARHVHASESDDGIKLNSGLIKVLTGRDPITARFLRENNFTFTPEFKLWLQANNAPVIDDDDDAMWRRVLRIPFNHTVEKQDIDATLKDRLANPSIAGPGVLAWAVRGCLEWQRSGLQVPTAVSESITSYRAGMDPLNDFYEEICVFAETAWVKGSSLHAAYIGWARNRGMRDKDLISQKALTGRVIKFRGCKPHETNQDGRILLGIGLRTDDPELAF